MDLSTGEILGIVAAALLFCLASLFGAIIIFIACLILLVRPWDGDTRRDHRWATSAPYPVFWAASWVLRAAEYIVSLKPGTLRAAELSTMYIQSQVLFALLNLGIPDMLCQGPRSAADLAGDIAATVPVDWLERLLATAAAFGMLNRVTVKIEPASTTAVKQQASVVLESQLDEEAASIASQQDALTTSSHDTQKHQLCKVQASNTVTATTKQRRQPVAATSDFTSVYSLNGVSAVLTSDSPVSMKNFVKMFEDHYAGYQHLSEGIQSGIVPFELWSGGNTFWQHLSGSPRHAETFDASMHEVNQIGGTAVVAGYRWCKFDCVVDIAGGVGGFLADIMARNAELKGVLFDQPEQINRATKLWETTHSRLAHRVQLTAGDMFDAATVPRPPPLGKVAYVLRNILHDWSDADSVGILRSIRERIDANDVATGRVQLLVVEVTTIEELLPCHLAFRRSGDMTMLMAFGEGKERNTAQFKALFAASGFKLERIVPTCSVMLVLEARPV